MPRADPPLAGVRVLVTRPESQATGLSNLIREAGGAPLCFPTLTIEPVQPSDEEIEGLRRADLVIFISPNAATYGYPFLREAGGPERAVIAIGRTTRAVLQRAGCRDVYDPGEHSSSEDLLAQPILDHVSGRRICIVRGVGGRELLRDALTARHARVDYLECYRRSPPDRPDTDTLERALAEAQAPSRDSGALVITSTSTTGLDNLVHMTPERFRQRLLGLPLVVIGARQQTAARQRGWRGPVIMAAAGDARLVDALIAWHREGKGTVD